jgi:uncharacterized pyridoxamine 5'-phosphate oxidase family protein
MAAKQDFYRIMASQTDMALATCVEGRPNVRIVNFYYDEKLKTLYFSTFKNNSKVKEISQNPNVAFTTVPKLSSEHVKAKGTAAKSERTIYDMADAFIAKIPDYRDTIDQAGNQLVLFEITFDKAVVILDFDNISILKP